MATANQTLGRGKIRFSLFKTGTYTPSGFRYLGNTPAFSLNQENETLEHYSSDEGIREKDNEVILQTNVTGSLTMDDIQPENLALFFFGSASVLAQTSATGQSETFVDVIEDHSYLVGVSDVNPTGVRSLTNVVVKVGVTTKTLATDYTLDAELGMVTILASGSINTGDDVIVEYDRAAKSRKQIISGTDQIEGAILFESTNEVGERFDYLIPRVKLSPNGEFALKTDEWQQLPVSVEVLKVPGKARIYIDGRPYTA